MVSKGTTSAPPRSQETATGLVGPHCLQLLLEEVALMASGEVRQFTEDLVAVLAVERRPLEAERVQIRVLRAALASFLLGNSK